MRWVAGIGAGGGGGVESGEESDALQVRLNDRGTVAAGVFLAPVASPTGRLLRQDRRLLSSEPAKASKAPLSLRGI